MAGRTGAFGWLLGRGVRRDAARVGPGPMKLIVGLGNPGRKYEGTRHNVGFDVVAEIARQAGAGGSRTKFQAEVCEVRLADHAVLLMQPQTYMNLSGASVLAARDFYKVVLDDVLVVCDDFNLPLGVVRFRSKGSAGGQKGLANILQRLGNQEVPRLRVGIGTPPPQWDVVDFVLGKIGPDERAAYDAAVQRAAQGACDWARLGIQACMNQYNGLAPTTEADG